MMIPRAAAEEATDVGAEVGGDAGAVVPGEEVVPAGSLQESEAVRVKLLPTTATVAFSLADLILSVGKDSSRKQV